MARKNTPTVYRTIRGEQLSLDGLLLMYRVNKDTINTLEREIAMMRDVILAQAGNNASLITDNSIAVISSQNRTEYDLPDDVAEKIRVLREPFKVVKPVPVLKVTAR